MPIGGLGSPRPLQIGPDRRRIWLVFRPDRDPYRKIRIAGRHVCLADAEPENSRSPREQIGYEFLRQKKNTLSRQAAGIFMHCGKRPCHLVHAPNLPECQARDKGSGLMLDLAVGESSDLKATCMTESRRPIRNGSGPHLIRPDSGNGRVSLGFAGRRREGDSGAISTRRLYLGCRQLIFHQDRGTRQAENSTPLPAPRLELDAFLEKMETASNFMPCVAEDPGVTNWLDTGGPPEGRALLRWCPASGAQLHGTCRPGRRRPRCKIGKGKARLRSHLIKSRQVLCATRPPPGRVPWDYHSPENGWPHNATPPRPKTARAPIPSLRQTGEKSPDFRL